MKHLLLLFALSLPCFAQTTRVIGFADLQNYWPFEDSNAGSTAARFGGTNGTINGATLSTGLLGNCFSFNGSSQYITCGATFQPVVAQAWSISCWFFPTQSFGTIQEIVEHAGVGGANGYQMSIDASGKLRGRLNSSGGNFREGACATTVTLNAWHFSVITWDGSNVMSGYLDTVVGSNTSVGAAVGAISYSGNFSVGRYENGTSLYYGGKVDDVKCYNHAMTQSEVNYLFYCRRNE